ncbi:MAG TPA: hypothetical protein VJT75_16135 [Thermoleophilaceae bacterium]|nr:hypothetical protein [Thermoleophilaceae bacterium]
MAGVGYGRSVSLLADPPLLFANGEAYARLAPGSAPVAPVAPGAAAVVALFWSVSIPLYLDARWTRPLWRLLPGRSGRDFMVNFPGLSVDTRRAGARMHALAAVVFATYPLWFLAGYAHGRRA